MPKRRISSRKVLPVFYVFCEGEKTERNYLDGYVRDRCRQCAQSGFRRFKLDDVWRIEKSTKTDPTTLVRRAVRQKEKSPRNSGDQFWCVYDREPINGIPESVHLRALKLAAENEIDVAISNVCFEVWLLLHKQESCAPYASCDELLKRSNIKILIEGYEKGKKLSFSSVEINHARKQARKLNASTLRGCGKCADEDIKPDQIIRCNPSTNVYRILDAIDQFFGSEQ